MTSPRFLSFGCKYLKKKKKEIPKSLLLDEFINTLNDFKQMFTDLNITSITNANTTIW